MEAGSAIRLIRLKDLLIEISDMTEPSYKGELFMENVIVLKMRIMIFSYKQSISRFAEKSELLSRTDRRDLPWKRETCVFVWSTKTHAFGKNATMIINESLPRRVRLIVYKVHQ